MFATHEMKVHLLSRGIFLLTVSLVLRKKQNKQDVQCHLHCSRAVLTLNSNNEFTRKKKNTMHTECAIINIIIISRWQGQTWNKDIIWPMFSLKNWSHFSLCPSYYGFVFKVNFVWKFVSRSVSCLQYSALVCCM